MTLLLEEALEALEAELRDLEADCSWAMDADLEGLIRRRERMRKALSLLREGGWQPIETAPKDGTWFLACEGEGRPYLCYWEADLYAPNGGSGGPSGWFAENWMDRWGDRPQAESPTHWMPLPTPLQNREGV